MIVVSVNSFSGKELAESAFKDLESFFFYSSRFTVKREFYAKIAGIASCKGNGSDARIALSNDLCNHRHELLGDYIFTLLIISHELAHYLNFHNFYGKSNRNNNIALEARADNFGAQIFATIATFGKETHRNMKALCVKLDQKSLTEAIGLAIGRLYEDVYVQGNLHPDYPSPAHRAFATICGLLSFFNRYFGCLPENWSMWFLLTIIRESSLMKNVNPGAALNGSDEIVDKIYDLHKRFQSDHPLMSYGLKPPYAIFLFSNFQQSDQERKAHQVRITAMVEQFDIFKAEIRP